MTKAMNLIGDQRVCVGVVTEITNDDGKYIVEFDQTVFCPKGGGQKSDIGTAGESEVINVLKGEGGRILHVLDAEPRYCAGDEVELKVDPDRREQNKRNHSAGHAIAAVTEQCCPQLHAVGGHHYPGEGRVEFEGEMPALDGLLERLTFAVDELIERDCEISIVGKPFESRAIQFAGFEAVPCGGTHVASTSELAGLKLKKLKVKNNRLRISYLID
ncbi:Alanine--tRNA ligase [Rubripirellula tenax]|uniref:Alanine--tRNA ligase n=1 Tax=Rubripirellula tenax TaxID=2528015 RepID=A0A5C6F0I0_9BACT|nr:alanyl-tRNA editing protein [Rubripirellula tenax]TWU54792.1 Alanine--tRNA ligase [Rubripirellula tenax]